MAGLAAVFGMVATASPARADAVVSGSIAVTGLPLPIQLTCLSVCPLSVSATSSGDISGVNGSVPFDASWEDPPTGGSNFSISGGYTSKCELSTAWVGASIVSGTQATVSGVSLDYNGTTVSNASVVITFLGDIVEGGFAPITETVTINGGPQPISVFVPVVGDPGYLATVPMPPPGLCPNGSQTFSATGTFVTLG